MSARVYLMADFGKGLVRLQARAALEAALRVVELSRPGSNPAKFKEAIEAVAGSASWWLVEAENAEAARGTIHLHLNPPPVGEGFTTTFKIGRILASGGA